MVSNPIIPEETLQKIREVVMQNKKTKTGPQTIRAWLNEAASEKLEEEKEKVLEKTNELPEAHIG